MSKKLNEQSKFQVGLPHILRHHFPLDRTGHTGPASSFYPPNHHPPEYTITSILDQGGCIDSFGVGERLITSKSEPVFGAVYKIVAVEEEGVFQPRIKISENTEKIKNKKV